MVKDNGGITIKVTYMEIYHSNLYYTYVRVGLLNFWKVFRFLTRCNIGFKISKIKFSWIFDDIEKLGLP